MKSIPTLVERLIDQNGGSAALAAERLGSTSASLSRYRTGEARPRPNIEQRLRDLVENSGDLVDQAESTSTDRRLAMLEQAISDTLNSLREEFHRTASVSTRQDALDMVAALVFAHVTSIDSGGRGLGTYLIGKSGNAATSVNKFVSDAFAKYLPSSNGHHVDLSRFLVGLNSSDDKFARAVLKIFERNESSFRELHESGRDDLINEVFSRFMATSFVDEKEMGQYLTPPEVTRFMVELGFWALDEESQSSLLTPQKGKKAGVILDPSCGVGSFLAESIKFLHEEVRQRYPDKATAWLEKFVTDHVVGVDKSERMLRLANINLGLFGVPIANLYLANALAREGSDSEVTVPLEGRARLILTNPPFGATYDSDDLHEFCIAKARKRVDSELLFLERYVDWAAPGGIIVSIVPDSVLVNRGVFSTLRGWLRERCEIVGIISLPSVTFAAAGTTTKTSVLVLRKNSTASAPTPTFFGEAKEIGYDVVTRSGQRRRVRHARNDLPKLLSEFKNRGSKGSRHNRILPSDATRWDATFHAAPIRVVDNDKAELRVSDVANLLDERKDPRRLDGATFNYIEIGDIDSRTGFVGCKPLPKHEAPSRARKRVRAGDVLVSTVRPERGTIGVVPEHLDGAICSTGFAVLRCKDVHPLALAWVLRTESIKDQMIRNNVGIAYPVITEETCMSLVLPADKERLAELSKAAESLDDAQRAFETARQRMVDMASQPLKPTPKLRQSSRTKSRRQSSKAGSD